MHQVCQLGLAWLKHRTYSARADSPGVDRARADCSCVAQLELMVFRLSANLTKSGPQAIHLRQFCKNGEAFKNFWLFVSFECHGACDHYETRGGEIIVCSQIHKWWLKTDFYSMRLCLKVFSFFTLYFSIAGHPFILFWLRNFFSFSAI